MSSNFDVDEAAESTGGPVDVMRKMHPDLFSDSVRSKKIGLSRAVLDHQIDTLTSNSKEKEFEHLSRQVTQRLICPNLRPQTGPTGGGDAKVDSETLIVAPEVAERWWCGEIHGGSERWAFAFSAKKDWKTKFKKDVRSILSTKRNYQRIYFVTNQNVSDRNRSKAEDDMSADAGVSVTILDRNWLLTSIYENDLVQLAVSALGLVGNEIPEERAGPLDTKRLASLEELDRKLADPNQYSGADYQLAEDALDAALTSRGLERPRHEVEGRFIRATKLADKGGYTPQQLRAAYNYAWTAHWWFEDFALFNLLYDRVEALGISSISVDELEKIQNLWTLLSTAIARGHLSAEAGKFAERSSRLRARFRELAENGGRPNNALQAETSLALMDLSEAAATQDFPMVNAIWNRLGDIVDRTAHLGAFPIEQLHNVAERLGEYLESPELDRLFEKLITLLAERRSEGEAGEMLCRRGFQKLGHDRPYEAIRLFGRAEPLLVKNEDRGALASTLVGGSRAYNEVGLPWASRAKAIAAIDTCLSTFRREGEMPAITILAIYRLIWADLRLGRVGNVIAGLGLSSIHEKRVNLPPETAGALQSERENVDQVMGIHLLRAPAEALKRLGRLPSLLERLGLMASAFALVYALGGADRAIGEGFAPADEATENVDEMIRQWLEQPAVKDVTETPVFSVAGRSKFVSHVLGTALEIDVPDEATSYGVGESILAAFEAFMATSHEQDIAPQTEAFKLVVEPADGKGNAFTLTFDDDDSGTRATLVHPRELAFESKEDFSAFTIALRDAVTDLMIRMFFIRDVEDWMRRVADDERAFDRALTLSNLVVLNGNVFADPNDVMLHGWVPQNGKDIPFTREAPLPTPGTNDERCRPESRKISQEPLPQGSNDAELISHAARKHVSPINVRRWDRAQWRGTLFAWDPRPNRPPFLGVGFLRDDEGQKIFEELQARFGAYDEANDLRVAIIRGIDAEHPDAYAVSIGPNFENMELGEARIISGLCRINRMSPASSANLDQFLKHVRAVGGFILTSAHMNPSSLSDADFNPQFGIAKTTLIVRNAYELQEYDWDLMALDEDCSPVVPEGVDASPVLRALERRRYKLAQQKGQ